MGKNRPGWPLGQAWAGVASGARIGRGGLLVRMGRGGLESTSRPEGPYSPIPGTPGDVSRGPRCEEVRDRASSDLGVGSRDSGMVGIA